MLLKKRRHRQTSKSNYQFGESNINKKIRIKLILVDEDRRHKSVEITAKTGQTLYDAIVQGIKEANGYVEESTCSIGRWISKISIDGNEFRNIQIRNEHGELPAIIKGNDLVWAGLENILVSEEYTTFMITDDSKADYMRDLPEASSLLYSMHVDAFAVAQCPTYELSDKTIPITASNRVLFLRPAPDKNFDVNFDVGNIDGTVAIDEHDSIKDAYKEIKHHPEPYQSPIIALPFINDPGTTMFKPEPDILPDLQDDWDGTKINIISQGIINDWIQIDDEIDSIEIERDDDKITRTNDKITDEYENMEYNIETKDSIKTNIVRLTRSSIKQMPIKETRIKPTRSSIDADVPTNISNMDTDSINTYTENVNNRIVSVNTGLPSCRKERKKEKGVRARNKTKTSETSIKELKAKISRDTRTDKKSMPSTNKADSKDKTKIRYKRVIKPAIGKTKRTNKRSKIKTKERLYYRQSSKKKVQQMQRAKKPKKKTNPRTERIQRKKQERKQGSLQETYRKKSYIAHISGQPMLRQHLRILRSVFRKLQSSVVKEKKEGKERPKSKEKRQKQESSPLDVLKILLLLILLEGDQKES